MKELLQLVSAVVAAATSPEVAFAAVVGWFGHVLWTRRGSGRRKPNRPGRNSDGVSDPKKEENIDVERATSSTRDAKSPSLSVVDSERSSFRNDGDEVDFVHETNSADEVSPARLTNEIVLPALRELSILVSEIRENNLICSESIRWNGAKGDGTTWYDDQFAFDGFPKKMPEPSIIVEVSISLQIKSIDIPPKLEILDWRGYFRSKNNRISGIWERFPAIGPTHDSIPAS